MFWPVWSPHEPTWALTKLRPNEGNKDEVAKFEIEWVVVDASFAYSVFRLMSRLQNDAKLSGPPNYTIRLQKQKITHTKLHVTIHKHMVLIFTFIGLFLYVLLQARVGLHRFFWDTVYGHGPCHAPISPFILHFLAELSPSGVQARSLL